MRVWVIALILFINVTIQSTVLPFINICGAMPDTLLILVISFAILSGNPMGPVVGFFGGLIQDILFGNAIGVFAMQYMIIGYIVGLTYNKIYVGQVILPMAFAFASTIIKHLMLFVYVFFAKADFPVNGSFLYTILIEAVYSALLMPVIYHYMTKLYKYKFMTKKFYFK